jgi:DNA-binding response OmpR family regulator
MSAGVLVVEDQPQLRTFSSRVLERAGYRVWAASTIAQARSALAENHPDVVLLDIGLPDGDGVTFSQEIVDDTDAFVIFVTADDSSATLVRAMTAGGDSYLTKPFRMAELLAYVASAVRRRTRDAKKAMRVQVGGIRFDMPRLRAFTPDGDLDLTPREFSLLHYLALHVGEAICPERILAEAWFDTVSGDLTLLRNTVSRLRKKLYGTGVTVASHRGQGYSLEVSGA